MAKKPYYQKFGFYRDNGILKFDKNFDTLSLREEVAKGNRTALYSARYIKQQTIKQLNIQKEQAKTLLDSESLNYIQKAVAKQFIREIDRDISDLNGQEFAKKIMNIHSRQHTASEVINISTIEARESDYIKNYIQARATGAGYAGSYGEISGEEFDAIERAYKILGLNFNKLVHDELLKQDYIRGESQLYNALGNAYAIAVSTIKNTIPELTQEQLEQLASIANLEREIVSDVLLEINGQ